MSDIQVSKPRGLRNLGNTCFINTTLQCLSHCPQFLTTVLDEDFVVQNDNDDNILLQLQDVLYKLHIEKKTVQPKGFCASVQNSNIGKFITINEPNDLHEFLSIFIDELIESQKKQALLSERCEETVKGKFNGTLKNSITCTFCGHKSRNIEPFSTIMLSFHEKNANQPNQPNQPFFLDNMIDNAFKNEIVENRTCDKCQQKRNEIKTVSFAKFPHVLIFMIKRYDMYGRRINHRLQISKNIIWKRNGKHYKYSIKSIACHYGNIRDGHYYSLVYKSDISKWFMINDHSVEELSSCPLESVTQSSRYYVLFYERDLL